MSEISNVELEQHLHDLQSELADTGRRLRRSEQRNLALAAATGELTWTLNASGQLLDASKGFQVFTGWTPGDLPGPDLLEAIHPADRARVSASWAEAVALGQSFEIGYKLRDKSGGYREFCWRGVPVAEEESLPAEWVCTATDVTSAKRAEAAQTQLAAIVESSDDAIFSVDLENVICSWNKGAEKLFGYTASEMVGNTLALLMPGTSRDLELDRKCVQNGVAIKNHDVVRRRKDGTLVTVSLTVSPIRDADGVIIGVSKIGRDITERQQAEEVLLQQANMLDNAYEPMIAWTLSGAIVYWNRGAEDLYGFGRDEAVGRSIHQLLQTVYPVSLEAAVSQLETEHLWGGEVEHTTNTGTKMTVESRQKMIHLPDGHAVVLQSDRDISLRKQAESSLRQLNEELERRVEERTHQLAETNRELESFSHSVSHDLRGPLRSLKGFTKILVMDYAGKPLDERALDMMNRMGAAVVRMGQLIEDLLQLSRVSRADLRLLPVNLSKLAADVFDTLRSRDPERQVHIGVEPGVVAVADARLLRLALENLLENAWKFTGKVESPRIEVGVLQAGGPDKIYLVRDNGAGFDMAYEDQLFAPFQRLHQATEFEGTGIGLATVKRVIQRHAGRIWAESSPGQGATFYFTLGKRENGSCPKT